MAGFFGLFDYTKEGPGVYANEPPKGPFKVFFDVLGRKFWKLVTVNLLYIIFSLPMLFVSIFAGFYVLQVLFPAFTPQSLEKLFSDALSGVSSSASSAVSSIVSSAGTLSGISSQVVSEAPKAMTPAESAAFLYTQIATVFSFLLVGLQLFVLGPTQAGVTYILRNYSREEHAFIWGDFKDRAKSNFKQSSITAVISFVATIVFSVNLTFYTSGDVPGGDFVSSALTVLMMILVVLFSVMQMYIYPMTVTFHLSLRQLYKNALLFAIFRLPMNIGILLISIFIMAIIPLSMIYFAGGIGIVLFIFYYVFIAFALNLYVTNFFVYRQLKKYMIDKKPSEEEEVITEEKSTVESEESIFKDTKPSDE